MGLSVALGAGIAAAALWTKCRTRPLYRREIPPGFPFRRGDPTVGDVGLKKQEQRAARCSLSFAQVPEIVWNSNLVQNFINYALILHCGRESEPEIISRKEARFRGLPEMFIISANLIDFSAVGILPFFHVEKAPNDLFFRTFKP